MGNGWPVGRLSENAFSVPIAPYRSRWVTIGPVSHVGWRELSGVIGTMVGDKRELSAVGGSNF